jgi:hypothetical protein
MYSFIRSAIFARAYQAYAWCKETGRIKGNVSSAEVDVLGRAYVIRKPGGGKFGVFVPVSLATPDGSTILIDPACFGDQPDIQAITSAGLL